MKLFKNKEKPDCIKNDAYEKLIKLNGTSKTDFVFITSGYNNSKWLEQCLNSIRFQEYSKEKFRIIYVDDASTDNSKEVYEKWISDNPEINITFKRNSKNLGPAGSRYLATKEVKDNEVCIFLDGDDWLENKNVLNYLSALYDMFEDLGSTYGGGTGGNFIKNIYYRDKEWNAQSGNLFPHLRTCRAVYAKAVPEEYLKYKGEWIKTCTDCALFICIEELCNNRHLFLGNLNFSLMGYNRENELNNKERGFIASQENSNAMKRRNEYSEYIKNLEPLKPLVL